MRDPDGVRARTSARSRVRERASVCARVCMYVRVPDMNEKSGHPESNQGPSDSCMILQSDALPTEL